VTGGLEDGAAKNGGELVRVRLGDPDVTAAIRKLLRIGIHSQLQLRFPFSSNNFELQFKRINIS
jgi:hypothetical protein